MDIDQSLNLWFERISLIQKKADYYKLRQDILSSLSDKDGLDFYIKSKGVIIGAHTCILRCRCPRFYYEIIKIVDVSNLPIHLLEQIADFIKCVYSENNVTALENKLIKSINVDYLNKKKRCPSIDLYERKQISCDINPLYYSLAYFEDFSSSEFSNFEQCTYNGIHSIILNQGTVGNSSFGNMDINLNHSFESHQIKSQSNSAGKKPNILTDRDSKLDEKCSDRTDIGNKVKIVNNGNCVLQHDLMKKPNALDDINSFLDLELAINHNNTLESSINVQPIELNSSAIQNVENMTKDCKLNSANVDSLLNKNSKEENISLNNYAFNKTIQETNDDLDVVSLNNFETFTVINKENKTEDIFCNYNNIEDSTDKIDQDQLKSESLNFQTFTVINESIIIDNDSQKDITLNSETFKSESSNDYTTFTVVNGINTSSFQECNSSNLILSNSKPFINNNDVIDLDVLPSTNTLSQFGTITILPESNNDKNKIKEVNDLLTNLNSDRNELSVSEFDIVSTKRENSKLNDFHNQINFKVEDTTSKGITNCSNNYESFTTSNEHSANMKQCNDVITSKLCTFSNNTTLNCISENSNSKTNNNSNYQDLQKLKISGESDSTLSLHLEILENSKGMNSPDSLNEDDVFNQEEKPIVSNKLEFVPLEATPIKDNRSPRLSRKYMECSPVISANAYILDTVKSSTAEKNSERKNSSSFFIDFNEGKPKNKPKRFENLTKSLDSSTIASSKEKIFSMFIDFNKDSESSESSFKGNKHRKPQTLADRFVRMHSEETSVKSNDHEDTVTPPPSRMTSTVENSSVDISESCKKQSVFMFIENDSPTSVKRRSLPQSSRLKSQRNSWNVDSTVVHKTHHRTHSVNLSEESNLDARMTQSHIETGSKEFNKFPDSFNSMKYSVAIKENNAIDSQIGLTDSFVRLSDMDKAPSKQMISGLNKCESKSDSLRRDLKNTELGRCLKRMFPFLKSTEIECILLSKPPHCLDSKEEIKTGLGQDLLRMFLEEIGADTTIDVNGRRIKAHKCVLTSRCQYFAAMFSGGWVQSAGNVLYLKGFSYKTVHLTLRYIYSGECNFSEIKNVAELSKLADMLCLEGLKDNIMLYLAAEYCHFFKEVCERCTIGILECLTLSVAYGLDDLYLSCIVWINDNFAVVWPTDYFISLPQDLKAKCFKHKVAYVDDLNDVLSVTEGCEKIKKNLPSDDERTKEIIDLISDLSNSVIKYLAKSFYSTITSKYFKQVLECENLFADSFASHLLASCNCANRNQIRQAYDHLSKSSSNNFWHAQGEILVKAIMELIVKGLASDFRNGRERQAMGSLPNDYRMSEALAKKIALELGVSNLELTANGTLITSSPVKKMTTSSRTLNKTPEKKVKSKTTSENIPISKIKTSGKFSEVKSRYMEPKLQLTTPTPQKISSFVHKDLPRGHRIISSSTSLSLSPSIRNTMSSSRLSTNRIGTGLKTKTSSELSLSTPRIKPRTVLPKTDPLPLNTRKPFVMSKTTPKSTRKPLQSNVHVNDKKMTNEKIMNSAKKPQTITPKTKSLSNGHPTIGSRSGTFCKDEPTVIHSKDIKS